MQNIQQKCKVAPNAELESIIDHNVLKTVTSGALNHFSKKVQRRMKNCGIIRQDGEHVVVKEKRS